MTIAACYLTPEGVVFGADSASTFTVEVNGQRQSRHYNHAQKIFQVGEISTLGVVIWGAGGLPHHSHRTLIADFADRLKSGHPLPDMLTVARRWGDYFWGC